MIVRSPGRHAMACCSPYSIRVKWASRTFCANFVVLTSFRGSSMKIDIERLGLTNVSIDPETLFTFPEGIAGFEECKRFKLFHEEGKATVFWLQSVDDTSVMFPIVAPEAFDIEYQIELSDADCALIDLQGPDDVAVVVIVYRNEAEGGKIAANTRSPVILNTRSRKGMQKVLQEVHPTLLYRAR